MNAPRTAHDISTLPEQVLTRRSGRLGPPNPADLDRVLTVALGVDRSNLQPTPNARLSCARGDLNPHVLTDTGT